MPFITRKELAKREFEAMKAGFVRGLWALPLTVDDAGKTRDQLLEKYKTERVHTP